MADSLAGHLHGLGDRADPLGAVGVGACPGTGPVHGAGTGQGGRPGASKSGHTGRGHWEERKGSVRVDNKHNNKYKRGKKRKIKADIGKMWGVHANVEH